MKTNRGSITPLCVLLCICFLLSSCNTTRKVTITGNPGTEIYFPDGERIGVVDDKGVAKIKIKVNKYNAYLLGKSKDSSLYVPFALDFKNKNSVCAQIIGIMGYTVGYVGLLEGIIFTALGDPGVGIPMLALGGAGLGVGIPVTAKNFGFDATNSFRYVDSSTDNDMVLSNLPSRYEGPNKLRGKSTPTIAKPAVSQKNLAAPKNTPAPKAEAKADQFKHTVAEGETLVSIAQQYGVNVAAIIKANKLTGNTITTGQQLVIPL